LTDGQSFTTDNNGMVSITLPQGYYHYKASKPAGYGVLADFSSEFLDYHPTTGDPRYTYTIKVSPPNADDNIAQSFEVTDGMYDEIVIQLIRY
jgi:hypothetical protein